MRWWGKLKRRSASGPETGATQKHEGEGHDIEDEDEDDGGNKAEEPEDSEGGEHEEDEAGEEDEESDGWLPHRGNLARARKSEGELSWETGQA